MRLGPPVLAAAAAALLAGCAGSPLAEVKSASELGRDELILVGKVKLSPPLAKDEQRIRRTLGDWENKIVLALGEGPKDPKKELSFAEYAGRIEATLGRTFFVRRERGPFFVREAFIMMDTGGRAYFPSNFKVAAGKGDGAVYIGTIHYKRDEFFNVLGVAVEDEFDEAEAAFGKRYGGRRALRKALAVPVAKR